MKLNYKLGELIRNIDVKNKDLHCNNLKGLSMTKEFRASTSNIVGTDLSKYKIVAYKQFACDFMSAIRVHKMPIAFNSEMEEILVSPAYAVFEVIDENIILPEYLMMRFRRSEFDRYADFRSDAAIRGGYGWNELCETEIKLPSLEEQRKKVQAYKTITDRIELKKKINDNLEATAQAYFDNLFFSCDDTDCTLADIALVNPSRPLSKGVEARCFDMSTLPTSGCIPTGDTTKPYNGGVRFINGDTLIARITPCLENGKAAYINILNEGEVAFGSTEYIVFASKDDIPSCFYYFLIRNSKFVTFALQFMNGSSGRQRVSGEELASFPLMIPSKEKLAAFNKVGKLVLEQMKESTEEIQFLKQLQETITATLSSN